MATMLVNYDIDRRGVDIVPTDFMRRILKMLILRGFCVKCALCHKPIVHESELSLDHTVPRSHGGSDYLHNMQPAHRTCNEKKGNNINAGDVERACTGSDDSPAEILKRKRKRKYADQKHRNIKRIKPWEIDNSYNKGR